MYRRMVLIRRFEETVTMLMSTAEVVGAAHLSIGQEAAIVGACMALAPEDNVVGTHRSHGHPIAKGAAIRPLLAELLGRRTGVSGGKGGSMHLADFTVGSLGETAIVGSGLPIAVGAALSSKLLGTGRVALVFFGDGAAGEGTFHESLNLAAIWKLPVIFYCENNQYAITTSVRDACAVPDIADRAVAYAIPGEVVDGQDPLTCWAATRRAVERARKGAGPTLIEAKTYRYSTHSWRQKESRAREEMEAWKRRDPIVLFRRHLMDDRIASEPELSALDAAVATELADALASARQDELPDAADAFTDLYADDADREAQDRHAS